MNINTAEFGVDINETVYNQAVEQSVDTDFTLPDYCSNIQRVLKCITTPVIVSKSINGNQSIIDGIVEFCFIYVDENNLINSYCYSYPFNKTIDITESVTNPVFSSKIKVDYMNIRAVSERRVEIHGAVGISLQIYEKSKKNIVSDIDSNCVFQKTGSINAVNFVASADKHILIEDDIEIGQGKPEIKNIVKKSAEVFVTECKIISNKVIIKGNLNLKILYCPKPEDKLQCFETFMPFSQVTELNGITDECKCDTFVEVLSLDINLKSGLSGECRTMSVMAKLMLNVNAYCDNNVPVVFDAFSNKYNLLLQKEEVTFKRIVTKVNENHLCNKVLEFSENSISFVVDVWGDTYISSVKCEGNKAFVNGTVNVSVLAYDNDSMPVLFDRGIDFKYSFSFEETKGMFTCVPKIKTVNISYNLLDYNKIEIRAELNVNAKIYDTQKVNLITKIELNEEINSKRTQDSALILYFANSGEEIWDIAKKYNASPKEVCEINETEEGALQENKVLLIP